MSRFHSRLLLNRPRWLAVRRRVLERDRWRCRSCGKAGRLEVDHVTPLRRDPGQNPYSLAGLQTLCRSCHLAKTARENQRDDPARDAWRRLVKELF